MARFFCKQAGNESSTLVSLAFLVLQQAPSPQPKPLPCSAKHSRSFVLHCKAWLTLALLAQRREPEEPRYGPASLAGVGR